MKASNSDKFYLNLVNNVIFNITHIFLGPQGSIVAVKNIEINEVKADLQVFFIRILFYVTLLTIELVFCTSKISHMVINSTHV